MTEPTPDPGPAEPTDEDVTLDEREGGDDEGLPEPEQSTDGQ